LPLSESSFSINQSYTCLFRPRRFFVGSEDRGWGGGGFLEGRHIRVDLLVSDGPGTDGIDTGPGEGSTEAGGGAASRMAPACSRVSSCASADFSAGRCFELVAVSGCVSSNPRAVGDEGFDMSDILRVFVSLLDEC
jgi:hypothetical protein